MATAADTVGCVTVVASDIVDSWVLWSLFVAALLEGSCLTTGLLTWAMLLEALAISRERLLIAGVKLLRFASSRLLARASFFYCRSSIFSE